MPSSTLTLSIRQFDKDPSKNGLCKLGFESPMKLDMYEGKCQRKLSACRFHNTSLIIVTNGYWYSVNGM